MPVIPDRASIRVPSRDDFWVDTVRGESPLRPWDQLQLGTVILPGLWQVTPAAKISFDVAKQNTNIANPTAPPKFRITITDKGYEPAQVKARGAIWTLEDWNVLQKVLPQIAPKKTTSTRSAWDIVHPATKLLGIDQVIINGVTVNPPVNQTLIVDIDMTQYFPQTKIFILHSSGGPLKQSDFTVAPVKAGDNIK
jgi:hypothetical protein